MLKKIGHESSGSQVVKSQKISVFIVLSRWISSSSGYRLSKSNCTQTFIICKNSK